MSEPAPARPDCILIVDDNATNIAFLFDALQALDYELRIARDGQSALEKVASELPDLILLDVMMPGLDGFETCRRLKANPKTAPVPVIFMTGMSDLADKVRGFEVGGVDYLVKPVRLPELRARLNTHLKLKHLQSQLQAQNRDLAAEIDRRQSVEVALRESQADLERKVNQRTEELRATNEILAQKIQALQVAEADLQQTLVAAEAASEAKSQFLAKMSHELRTPLNAILGFSQLLAGDSQLPPKQQQYLDTIQQSGDRLLNLIEDILEVVKFESGQPVYTPSPIALVPWLRDLIAPFQAQARAQALRCELELAEPLPSYISTDPTKLQQVLWHLLDNAIKFTTAGSIQLAARWQPASAGESQSQLTLAVSDTGPGMSAAELQQWLEPFAQTRSSSQPLQGTGIGLTIAQQAVRLLGGELQVESCLGSGSCFHFALPVLDSTESVETPARETIAPTSLGLAPDQPAYQLLVATETAAASQRLYDFLVPLGFGVAVASIADLAAAWQTVQPPLSLLEANAAARAAIARLRETEAQLPATDSPVQIVLLLPETAPADPLPGATSLPLAWSDRALLDTLATCLGARYLYRQPPPPLADDPPLTAEVLRALPPTRLQELYDAAVVVDEPRVRAVVAQLGPERARVQRQLIALLDDFRFDILLDLLQRVMEVE